MWPRRIVQLTSTVAVTLSLIAAMTAPADANTATFSDRAHDANRGVDILRVRVNNGPRIVVSVQFQELSRDSAGGVSVFFDTRGADHGPEYVVHAGVGYGTDYQAVRIEGWRDRSGHLLLHCDLGLDLNYARDTATIDVKRSCFQHPGRIRVNVVRTGLHQGSEDYAPRRHRFYDWVLH